MLTRPKEFDVIATLNLNGDYLSDALAAQVGGIGIAPGGNINYVTGHAIFEATHGTAPKYADQDKVNPGSVILSGEMMLRYLGWTEAADLIIKGLDGAIASKRVTYDFARLMEGATEIKCCEFGDNIIAHIVTALPASGCVATGAAAADTGRDLLQGGLQRRAVLRGVEERRARGAGGRVAGGALGAAGGEARCRHAGARDVVEQGLFTPAAPASGRRSRRRRS